MPCYSTAGGKKKKDETILIIFPQKPHHHHHFVPYQSHEQPEYGGGGSSYGGGGGHEMSAYSGGDDGHGSASEMFHSLSSGHIPYSIPYDMRHSSFRPRSPSLPQSFTFRSSSPGSSMSSYMSNPSSMSSSSGSSSPIIYGPEDDSDSAYDFDSFSKRTGDSNGPTILTI